MGVALFPSKNRDIWSLACLQAYQLYIICVKNLQVEIDTSYIKGMLNNLDIQPGAEVSRWIVGIKLFQFDLVHVPGCLHMGPDGLSCHASSKITQLRRMMQIIGLTEP